MPNHAIVIGIDRYATDLSSLNGPVADAQAFAQWLISSSEVDAQNLRLGLLPGDESPPLPASLVPCRVIGTSLAELNKALDEFFAPPLPHVKRLYFFFSGHGAASSNPFYGEEAICMAGFADQDWREALELSSLLGTLNAVPAEQRVIFIDGCRNAVSDTAQFGALSQRRRAAPGQRCNYVLRATGPGRKAAELDGRGLFARYLVDGLRGAGAAKRWDPAAQDGEGGYTVRWRSLGEYVFAQVAQHRAAQRHEQLIYEEGEHPASEDPVLAAYGARHFPLSTITVRLVDPAQPPGHTQIHLRRNDSSDPDLRDILPTAGRIEFKVPQSGWMLSANAEGWSSRPKTKAVLAYAERVDEELILSRAPPGGFETRWAEMLSRPLGGVAEAPQGQLSIRLNGLPPGGILPPIRIAVRRDSGELVVDPVMVDPLPLDPGLYRVRADAAGGTWAETTVLVEVGEAATAELALPSSDTPALAPTLLAADKPPPADGFALPSELLGPIAGTTVATVAALATVQGVLHYAYGLRRLDIGHCWYGSVGIEVQLVDEGTPQVGAGPGGEAVLVHAMRDADGEAGARAPWRGHPGVPIWSGSQRTNEGGHWVELDDPLAQQSKTGFSLATCVFAQHVTLVMLDRMPSGAVVILQYAIRQDPDHRLEIQRSLVQAEAFQRARAAGRDPLADPNVWELAHGAWFEPISALVACSALFERGDEARELFHAILAKLIHRDVRSSDLTVLRAARAARDGRGDLASALVRDALGSRQAPLVDALLGRLIDLAQKQGLPDKRTAWITADHARAIGHPLWTLRRNRP
ncbi:caspase family protein [Variovorax saccharolyticus]|uniref:caspase family protein n=1 Tax=Variovorax saccharolyticus TaxID=3053516 RepID=UPI0025769068|nr:caspase family protein [Variovorax sp. J31P216]MDM0029868.1 caspase family protein [Variovorax sp. J31P216]